MDDGPEEVRTLLRKRTRVPQPEGLPIVEDAAKPRAAQPVTCLGMPFDSEDSRREYFRNELRGKLPELKQMEGFPIGKDEDIIALSDPPYYTACPNPWINDFIAEWEMEKDGIPGREPDFQVTEPYASDVSEGKNNPIYNAHSYHTKVPHPAIMRYILHYTQPGDIVFDGFAGTGMTGVAAQMCGNPDNELKHRIEIEWRQMFGKTPQWGPRKAICGDLSPIASFIAYNYNTPVDVDEFEKEANRILKEVESECGWMYETIHAESGSVGKINFVVWSDIFICPHCGGEIIFWDAAVDKQTGKVNDEFNCTHCLAHLTKRSVSKAKRTVFDKYVCSTSSADSVEIGSTISQTKTVPVLINYSVKKKRHRKSPDESDFALIQKIDGMDIPYWYPTDKIIKGDKTGEPLREGITHVHHFYTKQNLWVMSTFWDKINNLRNNRIAHALKLSHSSANPTLSKMRRYRADKKGGGVLPGTLYISSITTPPNVILSISRNIDFVYNGIVEIQNNNCNSIVSTSCASYLPISDNSTDYIFTDPPFGNNLMYSELNFLWESWLKIRTNNKTEAIENRSQGKTIQDYQVIMTRCFKEYFRILKPGKWMTVEFSNTSAAVWNGIQIALQRAGFVIANVASIDKQQGSFNAVTSTTAVKQDLVISCYKPSDNFEHQFTDNTGNTQSVRMFLEEHLRHLPIHFASNQKTTAIIERSPKILYDRLISLYIMRGLPVPLDAADFQELLVSKFIERDGMYFLPDQVEEYDEKKAAMPQFEQMAINFETERDGLEWLRIELNKTSQTYSDLHPKWMKAITAVRKGDILPELKVLLEENFIQLLDGKWRSPDIHEAKDREIMRNKNLLKEFHGYLELARNPKGKRLKDVRVEALLAGFKHCWTNKDFVTILTVAERIPQNILLEDEQLLMFYDIAKERG
jgi:DNA modification methylase